MLDNRHSRSLVADTLTTGLTRSPYAKGIPSMRLTDMETTAAILEQIRLLEAEADQPIGLYDICVPLIGAGYTKDQILKTLFSLESKIKIGLLQGTR